MMIIYGLLYLFSSCRSNLPPERELTKIINITNDKAYTACLKSLFCASTQLNKAGIKLTIQENNLPHAETLPGGQIVITNGFLDCMQYEAELAFVLAHEMGHVLGQHAEKELELVGTPEGVRDAQARRLRCELEADREGLLLMARAGYDPRVGLRFWQRFNSTPEAVLQQQLAGTHPSHEERMRAMRAVLPEAMQLYHRAEKQRGKGKRLRKRL